MERLPFFLLLAVLFCLSYTATFGAESVILTIREVPDDFFDNAILDENETCEEGTFIVIGIFNAPSFSIKSLNNITVQDANSRQIPLQIERASVYREFDEINSVRLAFKVSKEALSSGSLRLAWGDDVSATNSEVERLRINAAHKERYRTFGWEEAPKGGSGEEFSSATLEVIVDDSANLYYLWYLLPMALIFSLLLVRKVSIGNRETASEQSQ
ncbi:MAG: hypothetical protein N2234_05375 [Planctomycetota bacterium]|nr:hypothetical protein [Planctomycetota bacterium]